jgi:hypothetical protein
MHDTATTPLPLLTPDQRERLLANGRRPGRDHVPVVKFFNPVGIGTWLATELDAGGDIMFGLAQLNDAPELGSFSLEELAALELPFGMHIERDLFFTGAFPLSAYAEAARETGSITAAIRVLSNAMLAERGEGA